MNQLTLALINAKNPNILELIVSKKRSFFVYTFSFVLILLAFFINNFFYKQFFLAPVIFVLLLLPLGYFLILVMDFYRDQGKGYEFFESEFVISKDGSRNVYHYEDVCFFEIRNDKIFFGLVIKGQFVPQLVYTDNKNLFNLLSRKSPHALFRKSYKECRQLSRKFDLAWKIALVLSFVAILLPVYLYFGDFKGIQGFLFLIAHAFSYLSVLFLFAYMEKKRLTLNFVK